MRSRAFPQQAYRACLGVLRLSNHYGNACLDQACHKALLAGVTRYQQVEAILKNNLEAAATSMTETPSIIHNNIRGSQYYQ